MPDPRGSVAATVRALGFGIQPSDVWRTAACALLRLNPKECDALALVFEDDAETDDTRMLVLDLLAGAGTFEAQVVMRRVLALAIARRNNRTFATYVQRLGFVETPDGPTLRFLMSVYAESRGEPQDVRAMCAYALGAAAGNAYTSGDVDAAVRASDVLRRDLLAAGTVPEKCSLLTSIGNAGVPSDVGVIARFAADDEAAVRAACALAYRKMNVPEARAELVALIADRSPKVAEAALKALSDQRLDDEELEALAESVLAGRTSRALDGRVLRFLVAQRPKLSSCPGRASAIENALRVLLGRVEMAATEITGRSSLPPPLPPTSISGERPAMSFPSITQASPPPSIAPATTPQFDAVPTVQTPVTPSRVPTAQAPVVPAVPVRPQIRPIQGGPRVPGRPPFPASMPPLPLPSQARRASSPSFPPPPRVPGATPSPAQVDEMRARMLELGLDPDARASIIPAPPARPVAAPHPYAVVRGR